MKTEAPLLCSQQPSICPHSYYMKLLRDLPFCLFTMDINTVRYHTHLCTLQLYLNIYLHCEVLGDGQYCSTDLQNLTLISIYTCNHLVPVLSVNIGPYYCLILVHACPTHTHLAARNVFLFMYT
jgi:hypothetical protein